MSDFAEKQNENFKLMLLAEFITSIFCKTHADKIYFLRARNTVHILLFQKDGFAKFRFTRGIPWEMRNPELPFLRGRKGTIYVKNRGRTVYVTYALVFCNQCKVWLSFYLSEHFYSSPGLLCLIVWKKEIIKQKWKEAKGKCNFCEKHKPVYLVSFGKELKIKLHISQYFNPDTDGSVLSRAGS